MSGSRPKRASVSTSYAHLLKPLSDSEGGDSDSSESNGDDGEGASSQGGASGGRAKGKAKENSKKKSKRRAMSDDDDTEGSVYEEENKDSDASSSQEEDEPLEPTDSESEAVDEDDDEDVVEDDSDGGEGRGRSSSGAVGGHQASLKVASGSASSKVKKKPKPAPPGGISLPSAAKASSSFTRVRAPAWLIPGGEDEDDEEVDGEDDDGEGEGKPKKKKWKLTGKRRDPNAKGTGEAHAESIGPFWEPPSRYFPGEGEDGGSGKGLSVAELKIIGGDPMEGNRRGDMTMRWSAVPFSPARELLQDVSWWKGKWKAAEDDEENGTMATRWGGWYPEVGVKFGKLVTGSSLEPYLPKNIYPSRPAKLYIFDKSTAVKDEDMEDEGTPEPETTAMEVDSEIEVDDHPKFVEVYIGLPAENIGDGEEQDENGELLSIPALTARRLDDFYPSKPGHLGNAGGPVTSVSWCPRTDTSPAPSQEYLALSTSSTPQNLSQTHHPLPSQIQIWSLDTSIPTDLTASTNPNEKGKGLAYEMGICVDIGECNELHWCPKGGEGEAEDDEEEDDEKLGLLAGSFTDGSIAIFAVPRPDVVRKKLKVGAGKASSFKMEPILKLVLPSTKIFSFAWGSHEMIAGGCVNGAIALWSVGDALRNGDSTLRPYQYFTVHSAPIRSLTFVRTPPLNDELDGNVDLDKEPVMIVSGSYDGGLMLTDLRDPETGLILSRERTAVMCSVFDPYSSTVLYNDGDDSVRAMKLNPRDITGTRMTSRPEGTVWSIAVSEHHPFSLTTAADGACYLSNTIRPLLRIRGLVPLQRKLYRIDFNKKTGKYKMIDNINPEKRIGLDAKSKRRIAPFSAGAWSHQTAVFAAEWHPSIQRACLVASGMACGLFRVDWVE